jgi:hypothetical protein
MRARRMRAARGLEKFEFELLRFELGRRPKYMQTSLFLNNDVVTVFLQFLYSNPETVQSSRFRRLAAAHLEQR